MEKTTKKRFMGLITTLPEFVKPEYLNKRKRNPIFTIIEIHSNSRYGAVAKIYERNSTFDRFHETTTKAERKKFSKAMQDIGKDNKRVDTSKWVKPDEESIRNALVESLFALEILKEGSPKYNEYSGKARALYSVLHSHSPNNPQTLTNYVIDPYFEVIMTEFKSPVMKKYWQDFNKFCNRKNNTKEDWENRRKKYQEWKKQVLSKMIIKDPNAPGYKDIFNQSKRGQNETKKERKQS